MYRYCKVNQIKPIHSLWLVCGCVMIDIVDLIYWPTCCWSNLWSAFIECSGWLSWIISTSSNWDWISHKVKLSYINNLSFFSPHIFFGFFSIIFISYFSLTQADTQKIKINFYVHYKYFYFLIHPHKHTIRHDIGTKSDPHLHLC